MNELITLCAFELKDSSLISGDNECRVKDCRG